MHVLKFAFAATVIICSVQASAQVVYLPDFPTSKTHTETVKSGTVTQSTEKTA